MAKKRKWKPGDLRVCTRIDCRRRTRDWYPFSGSQRIRRVRCAECYENECRRAVRIDNPLHCEQEERQATIDRQQERSLEPVCNTGTEPA